VKPQRQAGGLVALASGAVETIASGSSVLPVARRRSTTRAAASASDTCIELHKRSGKHRCKSSRAAKRTLKAQESTGNAQAFTQPKEIDGPS